MSTASSPREFRLDRVIHDDLIAHARSDVPYEVCGLLAGRDGEATAHYRIPNAARSMTFYNMDPKALLTAMNEMDDRGWDLVGIYHSHTHTEAYPSATDVELAFYAEAVYLIVSLQDPDVPHVRAFDIVDGQVSERALVVDGEVDERAVVVGDQPIDERALDDGKGDERRVLDDDGKGDERRVLDDDGKGDERRVLDVDGKAPGALSEPGAGGSAAFQGWPL